MLAYVCGREVLAGAGVLAATDNKFLVYHGMTRAVTTLELKQITGFEAVRGKYGHTVRIHTEGRSFCLYGADRSLAAAMHEALQAKGISTSFEDLAPRGTLWEAYSGPHPSAQECLLDARQRLLAA